MTNRSGWCAPAFGLQHTRSQHVACRSAVCGCEDFGGHESLSTEGRKVLAMRGETWEDGRTNQDGPGPAALTAGGSQGLARTLVRSAEL